MDKDTVIVVVYTMNNRYIGIYNVVGNRGTDFQAKIVPIKVEEYSEELGVKDIVIEEFDVDDNIRCSIARCCITDSFLTSTRVLPMYYITVFYRKATVLVMDLFKIFFCFTVHDDVKSANQLLNTMLSGKFHFELRREGFKKQLEKEAFNYPGEKGIMKMLKEYALSDQMKPVIKLMMKEKDKMIEEKYGTADQFTLPTNIIKLSEVNYDDE